MEIISAIIALAFFGYFFDFDSRTKEEAEKCKLSFNDVCRQSNTLTVCQYTIDHVKIIGIDKAFKLNSDVTQVVNEICEKYNFRIVNAEGARVYHLSKKIN